METKFTVSRIFFSVPVIDSGVDFSIARYEVEENFEAAVWSSG